MAHAQNFVSNRDIIIRSKNTGHAIEFKKGVATRVPRGMYDEVMERGILPVDEGEAAEVTKSLDDQTKILLAPEDALERSDRILDVMKAIIARNNSKDFTGGGMPHPQSITAALGWKVDHKEVRGVWEKNREALVSGARVDK